MECIEENLFECLPEEVILMILNSVGDCKSLVRCMAVCRSFYQYASSISSLCIVCPDNYSTYEEKLKIIFSMVKEFRELRTLVVRVGHPKDEPAPWARCMRYAEIGSSVEKFIFMAAKSGDFSELDHALTRHEIGLQSECFIANHDAVHENVANQSDHVNQANDPDLGNISVEEDSNSLSSSEDEHQSLKGSSELLWSLLLQHRLRVQSFPRSKRLSDFNLRQVIAPTNEVMKRMLPVIHFAILQGLNEFRDVIPNFVANFQSLKRFVLVDLLESVTIHIRQHHLDEIRSLHMKDMADWESNKYRACIPFDDNIKWDTIRLDKPTLCNQIFKGIQESNTEPMLNGEQKRESKQEERETSSYCDKTCMSSEISISEDCAMSENPFWEADSERRRKGKGLVEELHNSYNSTNKSSPSFESSVDVNEIPSRNTISYSYGLGQSLFQAHSNKSNNVLQCELFSKTKLSDSKYDIQTSESCSLDSFDEMALGKNVSKEASRSSTSSNSDSDFPGSDYFSNGSTAGNFPEKHTAFDPEVELDPLNVITNSEITSSGKSKIAKDMAGSVDSEKSTIQRESSHLEMINSCNIGTTLLENDDKQESCKSRMTSLEEIYRRDKGYFIDRYPLKRGKAFDWQRLRDTVRNFKKDAVKTADGHSGSSENLINSEGYLFTGTNSSAVFDCDSARLSSRPCISSSQYQSEQQDFTISSVYENNMATSCQQSSAKITESKIAANTIFSNKQNIEGSDCDSLSDPEFNLFKGRKYSEEVRKKLLFRPRIRNTGPLSSNRSKVTHDRLAERELWRETWRERMRRSRDVRRFTRLLEDGRRDWDSQTVTRDLFHKKKTDLEKEALSFDYSFWRAEQVVTENYHLSDVSMCIATFSAKPLGEADIDILSCAALAGPLLAATVSHVNKHHSLHNL